MSVEKITGRCPKCYHELEIPADLEEFSCLYCGAKLHQQDLVSEVPTGDFEQSMAAYRAALPQVFADYRNLRNRFTKKDYTPTFEQYEGQIHAMMVSFSTAVSQRPEQREALIAGAVTELLDAAQQQMEQNRQWKHRGQRENIIFDVKLVIALFLSPAIRQRPTAVSEDFAAELHRQWHEQHPKCPYQLCTYPDIVAGFRKRKLCFITTAVCQTEGKPDDCAELTAFRAFRDGYLSHQSEGRKLIEEYYEIAPAIVMSIDLCDDAKAVYDRLRKQYLTPCYQDLLSGREADCQKRYTAMVQELSKTYLSC